MTAPNRLNGTVTDPIATVEIVTVVGGAPFGSRSWYALAVGKAAYGVVPEGADLITAVVVTLPAPASAPAAVASLVAVVLTLQVVHTCASP
jgi:hypothetical protein